MGEIELYDGLDSDSVFYALTARQGKILNEKIENTATDAEITALFN